MRYMESRTTSTLSAPEVELVQRVHARLSSNEHCQFCFFHETTSPFSNFYCCTVLENGIAFQSTEQYMMYHKAKFFGDHETAEAILKAETPIDCQTLGRRVKNFNSQIWRNHRARIVYDGNYLKFTQNPYLKKALMEQNGHLLVEVAPSDGIWSIGLSENDPLIQQRSTWQGLNLLGYILTDVAHRIHDEDQ